MMKTKKCIRLPKNKEKENSKLRKVKIVRFTRADGTIVKFKVLKKK